MTRVGKLVTRNDSTDFVTRLWLDSTNSWLDSDSTRKKFRWLWLDSDSKGLWLDSTRDSTNMTRPHHCSNLTTLVWWKKCSLWEPWMILLLLHLDNRIVCFYYHLHFFRCLQRSQDQQQKFCICEKTNFLLNKKNAHQRWVKIASLSFKRCQSWAA